MTIFFGTEKTGTSQHSGASRELVAAIQPILREWVERKHGLLTFRLTQMLTGHGCFGEYLCRVAGREPTTDCHHCGGGVEDTALHTREECSAWAEPRDVVSSVIGSDLSLPTLMRAMVSSKEAWEAVVAFCDTIMSQKEAAKRKRENDT